MYGDYLLYLWLGKLRLRFWGKGNTRRERNPSGRDKSSCTRDELLSGGPITPRVNYMLVLSRGMERFQEEASNHVSGHCVTQQLETLSFMGRPNKHKRTSGEEALEPCGFQNS